MAHSHGVVCGVPRKRTSYRREGRKQETPVTQCLVLRAEGTEELGTERSRCRGTKAGTFSGESQTARDSLCV